jgi:hypothetical protein
MAASAKKLFLFQRGSVLWNPSTRSSRSEIFSGFGWTSLRWAIGREPNTAARYSDGVAILIGKDRVAPPRNDAWRQSRPKPSNFPRENCCARDQGCGPPLDRLHVAHLPHSQPDRVGREKKYSQPVESLDGRVHADARRGRPAPRFH